MICNTSVNLDTVEIGIGGFAQMIGHGIGYGTEQEKKDGNVLPCALLTLEGREGG